MLEHADMIDTVLRGIAAGVSFLLAIALGLHGRRSRTSVLGALFSFSTGVYVLISSDVILPPPAPPPWPLAMIGIWGTVFFWWFGSALFDDSFEWRWWRFAPFVLLPSLYLARLFGVVEGAVAGSLLTLHLVLNGLLYADVFRLAVVNAADDLVNPRRRFRVVISLVVGLFGVAIAIVELSEPRIPDFKQLLLVQAASIVVLNMVFAAWLLTPRRGLLALDNPVAAPASRSLSEGQAFSADRVHLDKLKTLMGAGAYRTEGLTVAALADQVGVPEHQLRKLINGALGFRNFSSFLNSYRIEDAKTALADPANARKQVLQIALDLGYGSIAPFNRAFKQATGKTPTDFRKDSLPAG